MTDPADKYGQGCKRTNFGSKIHLDVLHRDIAVVDTLKTSD